MTYVKVKGQSRSNVVKNDLLLPTLARRITKQVKDDDDFYEGQRSTEVISGQGTCHRDDTVMSSSSYFTSYSTPRGSTAITAVKFLVSLQSGHWTDHQQVI